MTFSLISDFGSNVLYSYGNSFFVRSQAMAEQNDFTRVANLISLQIQRFRFQSILNHSPLLASSPLAATVSPLLFSIVNWSVIIRFSFSMIHSDAPEQLPSSLITFPQQCFYYLAKGMDIAVVIHSIALVILNGSWGATGYLLAHLENAYPILPMSVRVGLSFAGISSLISPTLTTIGCVIGSVGFVAWKTFNYRNSLWKGQHELILIENYLAGLKRGKQVLAELKTSYPDRMDQLEEIAENVRLSENPFILGKFAVLHEIKHLSLKFSKNIPLKTIELIRLRDKIDLLNAEQSHRLEQAIFLGPEILPNEDEKAVFNLLHHAATYYHNTYSDKNDSPNYRPNILLNPQVAEVIGSFDLPEPEEA